MHRPGVFAEQVAVPRRSLVELPAGLDPQRAVLAEPLACCVGALAPHSVGEGSSLAVFGCGPLGLLAVHLGARAGAHVAAVDPLPERLETARRLGAAVAVSNAGDLEPGAATIALDAAGFESTWRGAIDAVQNGGTVVVLGLGNAEGTFPMAVLVRRGDRAPRPVRLQPRRLRDRGRDPGRGRSRPRLALVGRPRRRRRAFANLVDRPAQYTKVILHPA